MPYIPIDQVHPDIMIGMWKVEEDEDYFRSRLNIYENEERILEKISHPVKRLEWLSSRLCLKELLKISHKVESLNEQTGRPYLSDGSFFISYSHSNLYSGAIASSKAPVSIDLENLSKKRNPRTRFLFMHPDELRYYDESEQDLRVFFLFWSCKETLYKIYAERGVIFKENLIIRPGISMLPDFGKVIGEIRTNGTVKEYEIYYRFFSGVLLTYTFDSERL